MGKVFVTLGHTLYIRSHISYVNAPTQLRNSRLDGTHQGGWHLLVIAGLLVLRCQKAKSLGLGTLSYDRTVQPSCTCANNEVYVMRAVGGRRSVIRPVKSFRWSRSSGRPMHNALSSARVLAATRSTTRTTCERFLVRFIRPTDGPPLSSSVAEGGSLCAHFQGDLTRRLSNTKAHQVSFDVRVVAPLTSGPLLSILKNERAPTRCTPSPRSLSLTAADSLPGGDGPFW